MYKEIDIADFKSSIKENILIVINHDLFGIIYSNNLVIFKFWNSRIDLRQFRK
mgnify:CR=1 FL=1